MTLLAMSILLLLFTGPATEALKQWTGARFWSPSGRATAYRALGILVLVALCVALDPEVRALLILVDAIGVDIFLMLLLFQGQEVLRWLHTAVCCLALRRLETWGWFPLPLPYPRLFQQHPWWSLYAATQLVVMGLLISTPLVVLLSVLKHALT